MLDEMLSRKFAGLFAPEMERVTIRQQGWGEKTKEESSEAAEQEFDALETMDRGIPHQQNLTYVDLVSSYLKREATA